MQIFKCDRCGTVIQPEERFCAHIGDRIADLCEICHQDFLKDKEASERLYKKNMDAIAFKYGMARISELLRKGEK